MRLKIVLGWGFVLALCLLLTSMLPLTALAGPSTEELIDDAASVIQDMTQQTDVETAAKLIEQAKGVAVFPRVIKAGLIIGGSHGSGLVLRRNSGTGAWYGPSYIEISGLSWGAQIGVQSTALLLVVTNELGMRVFSGGKITLGGEFSVAAGPVGRQAQAGTDARLTASIYSYSMTKGLFIGFSLEGAKIDDDPNANKSFWGEEISPTHILEKSADPLVKPVISALGKLMAKG